MSIPAAITASAAAITYRQLGDLLGGDGKTVKELLSHYAPAHGCDLKNKAQKSALYRRIRQLLLAGVETEEIIKKGSSFVRMTADEKKAHEKALAVIAAARAKAVEQLSVLGVKDATITDVSVVLPFAAVGKLAAKLAKPAAPKAAPKANNAKAPARRANRPGQQ